MQRDIAIILHLIARIDASGEDPFLILDILKSHYRSQSSSSRCDGFVGGRDNLDTSEEGSRSQIGVAMPLSEESQPPSQKECKTPEEDKSTRCPHGAIHWTVCPVCWQ